MKQNNINKLHFWIHPGCCSDPDYAEEHGVEREVHKRELEQREKPQLDRLIQRAEEIGKNEDSLLVVFTHSSESKMRQDLEEGKIYAKTIQQVQELLGDRCIILDETNPLLADHEDELEPVQETYKLMKAIAESRSLIFDSNVLTIAGGVSAGECVIIGANSLNAAGWHTKPTYVDLDITDYADFPDRVGKISEMIRQKELDCVTLDPKEAEIQ